MSGEPGLNPSVTALEEEGFGETTAVDVVESFARNMMVHLDAWQEKGFGAVAKSYLERLSRAGGLRSIADNGDLLSRRPGDKVTEHNALLHALAAADWYDPATKGPRA